MISHLEPVCSFLRIARGYFHRGQRSERGPSIKHAYDKDKASYIRTPTHENPWPHQYLKHAHSHITRAVSTMASCFSLIRAHQHDIAVRHGRGLAWGTGQSVGGVRVSLALRLSNIHIHIMQENFEWICPVTEVECMNKPSTRDSFCNKRPTETHRNSVNSLLASSRGRTRWVERQDALPP